MKVKYLVGLDTIVSVSGHPNVRAKYKHNVNITKDAVVVKLLLIT